MIDNHPNVDKVVKVGYGGAAIKDYPWHITGEQKWTERDDDNARHTIEILQITKTMVIDTAHRYGDGRSEEIIGQFLGSLNTRAREEFFVITKIGMEDIQHMYQNLLLSVQRLRGIPQCLLIHNPDYGKRELLAQTCEWLKTDVERMGIKWVGFSTEPDDQAQPYYNAYRLNAIQFPFSPTYPKAAGMKFKWVNEGHWILKIANRILGGPEKNKQVDPDKIAEFMFHHAHLVDVALVGTTNPGHFMEMDTAFCAKETEVTGRSPK